MLVTPSGSCTHSAFRLIRWWETPEMKLSIAYILVSVGGAAVGQLLLKRGMSMMGPLTLTWRELPRVVLGMATNGFVLVGLMVFVTSTFFWLTALSRVDLSFAYPFASLGYVIMLLASWQLLGEAINTTRMLGTVVVVLGVLLISRS